MWAIRHASFYRLTRGGDLSLTGGGESGVMRGKNKYGQVLKEANTPTDVYFLGVRGFFSKATLEHQADEFDCKNRREDASPVLRHKL